MRGGFTSQDDEMYKIFVYYIKFGIPFYILYVLDNPEGFILQLFIRYDDVLKGISSAVF